MLSLPNECEGEPAVDKRAILDVMSNGQPYMAIYKDGRYKEGLLLSRDSLKRLHRWSGETLRATKHRLTRKDLEKADQVAQLLFMQGRVIL